MNEFAEIVPIDKGEFYKPVQGPRKLKELFEDLYDKIDILNERLKLLEVK